MVQASAAYAPSKAALNQVTVQYAKQLRPEGILVNSADPGPCATDFTVGFTGLTRTAEDGARVVVRLATAPDGGPTGGSSTRTDQSPGEMCSASGSSESLRGGPARPEDAGQPERKGHR